MIHQHINGIESPLTRFALTCEPVSISMGVMAAASAAMQIQGQMQAKKMHQSVEDARQREQEYMIEENRRRATQDFLTQARLEQTQQQQEKESLTEKRIDLAMEAARTTSTAYASAAERGVDGLSLQQIVADYDFQAERETGRVLESQKLRDQQHHENINAYTTEYKNRVSSVRPYMKTPAQPVDYFGPIFRAGAQYLDTDLKVSQRNPSARTFTNWVSS